MNRSLTPSTTRSVSHTDRNTLLLLWSCDVLNNKACLPDPISADMREPVFEFIRPPVYHPPQVKYPHGQPLRYLERYRDGKQHTYGIYWYWGTQSQRGMCRFCLAYLCDIIKHFQLYWDYIVFCFFFKPVLEHLFFLWPQNLKSVSVAQNIDFTK